MSNLAIDIQQLSKSYNIKQGNRNETFHALKEVSLQLEKGKVLGIIGSNGAGKSTLLKILSQVTYPTSGKALIHGKLASLLEVGTGFHPELSGLENIYLNGAILGMRRNQIKKKLDEIVAFAGTEKFLQTPLKHYSSGMYVRLAFSVAAHLESDILLIDEVLAVGDADFQKKCITKIEETTKNQGRSVIFVSHNINIARNLCDAIAQLDHGKVVQYGNPDEVGSNYINSMRSRSKEIELAKRTDRSGNGMATITDLVLRDRETKRENFAVAGKKAEIEIAYRLNNLDEKPDINLYIGVFNHLGNYLTTLSNDMVGFKISNHQKEGRFKCTIEKWPLMGGQFYLSPQVYINGFQADYVQFAIDFETSVGDFYGCGSYFEKRNPGIFIEHNWQEIPTSATEH